MKVRTRLFSIVMIMILIVGCMSASSFAASPSTGKVYVKVTQDYGQAQKLLSQINKQRTKRGLKKLKLDKSLTNAAVQRAAEVSLVIPTSSPHKRPDGRYAKTVHKLAARENCAEGYFAGPSAVTKVWMNSKPHKATILLKSARSCGIAYVNVPGDEYENGYYVLIVSNSKAKSVQKSKKKVTSTKTIKMQSKYLKKKYFGQELVGNTTLYPGDTAKIVTTYCGPKTIEFSLPVIATKSFTWTSSNKNVATVSSSGKVTAVGPGTATIKAKLKNGPSITLSKKITVKEKPAPAEKPTPEGTFNIFSDYLSSCDLYWECGYDDRDYYAYVINSGAFVDNSYEDPETGEVVEKLLERHMSLLEAPEDQVGSELAFLNRYIYYEDEEVDEQADSFVIFTNNGSKLEDNVTLVHEKRDGEGNCIYRLEATAPRDVIIVSDIDWEVVSNPDEAAIDYELIERQFLRMYSDSFRLYLKFGVTPQSLGASFKSE